MIYINEKEINDTLAKASKAKNEEVDKIIEKSKELKRLSIYETAVLLQAKDENSIKKIFNAAKEVKEKIYGKRVVLFTPMYISNICSNNCLYCSFRIDNKLIERKALSTQEITEQTTHLLKRGHKRILMVAGEAPPKGKKLIDYYCESIKAIYDASWGPHKIKRVNINCAPLSVEEFKQLKKAGIGTFQVFQETYHEETYKKVHPSGPKSDPNNRIDAVDRAFAGGIDDVGIGVLYGLYKWEFETLAMLFHIEHLEKKFNVGPHTISVPRIEPALGSELSVNIPYKVTDDNFKKIVAVLRLAVPYTGIILSTRETPEMRDELLSLGVSQISAESKTSPEGHINEEKESISSQFTLNDNRTLDEIMASIIKKGFIPSFCAACYRKERTGEAFMNMAKPGTIKGMCAMNAMITLKEYLDDFASKEVKEKGYKMLEDLKACSDEETQKKLSVFFCDIEKGVRDKYV